MCASWSRFGHGVVLAGAVVVLAVVGLDSQAGGSSQPASPASDEAAVRTLVTQGSDAWNKGDADRLAALWAENGDLVTGDGTYCNGRQEIAKLLSRLLTGAWKGSRFEASVTSVRFLRPDVALLHLEAGFLLPGEGEPTPENRAVQSLVAVRDGSMWRFALYHSTRMRPPKTRPGD